MYEGQHKVAIKTNEAAQTGVTIKRKTSLRSEQPQNTWQKKFIERFWQFRDSNFMF